MTTKELTHVVKFIHMQDQGAAGSTAVTSGALDTQGWESAAVIFDCGVWTNVVEDPDELKTSWSFALTECDTDDGNFSAVDSSQMEYWLDGVRQDTAPVVDGTTKDQCCIAISYIGGLKRYIKGVATPDTGEDTLPVSIIGVLGSLRETGPKTYSSWSYTPNE